MDRNHEIIVSCLLRDASGRILLVKHHKRGWELPQGHVEQGESVVSALHREVLEETGVTIASPTLAVGWSKVSAPTALVLTFIASYESGELTASEETPEVRWFSVSEIADHVSHRVNIDRIEAALSFSGTPSFHVYTTRPYTVL